MDWKSFLYGVITAGVILLLLASTGLAHVGAINGNVASDSSGENIPEKCRPPAGQDAGSWKEHLGHHAETQDCLKYFK